MFRCTSILFSVPIAPYIPFCCGVDGVDGRLGVVWSWLMADSFWTY